MSQALFQRVLWSQCMHWCQRAAIPISVRAEARVTRHERLRILVNKLSSLSWCFGMPSELPWHPETCLHTVRFSAMRWGCCRISIYLCAQSRWLGSCHTTGGRAHQARLHVARCGTSAQVVLHSSPIYFHGGNSIVVARQSS